MTATAPTWQTLLLSWRFPTAFEFVVLVGAVGYLELLRRATRASRGGPAPTYRWARGGAWLLAMMVLVVAVDGPVAALSDVLFWVHMVQHLLLIMIVPVLALWAQPMRLAAVSTGPRGRERLAEVSSSRPFRWATAPLTGFAAYTAVVVLTHLTGFQQISATHPALRGLELGLYLVAGYLFFLPIAGSEPGPRSLPYLLRFLLLVVGMGADTLTGVVLMLTTHPLAPAYAAAHPNWGPSALGDQELAGAVMWFGGDLLMMLLMIVVAVQWSRAGVDKQGLGDWLEGIRRRAVLAPDAGGPVERSGSGAELNLDTDEQALRSYNAMLAALHERASQRAPASEERSELGIDPPTRLWRRR